MIKWRAEFTQRVTDEKGEVTTKWLGYVDFIQFNMHESAFGLAFRRARLELQNANIVKLFRM